MVPGTAGYQDTGALTAAYEQISFADVHGDLLHLFPAAPARVLDIGAGTGRDAAALARLGHVVTAAEPSPDMRATGQHLHADQPITWMDDHLPGLDRIRQGGQRFDLLLLSGVWMHLDAEERRTGMATLAALLGEGGRIVLSLRHGPVPPGRRMFQVSGDETVALAAGHGLHCLWRSSRAGLFGREGVRWTRLVFGRQA